MTPDHCRFCQYSEYRDKQTMYCNDPSKPATLVVRRDYTCDKFVREPGSEGDE